MSMLGIDVSSNQQAIDGQAVAASNVHVAIMRATRGLTERDASFGGHWDGARQAGLFRGAYHADSPGGTLADVHVSVKHQVPNRMRKRRDCQPKPPDAGTMTCSGKNAAPGASSVFAVYAYDLSGCLIGTYGPRATSAEEAKGCVQAQLPQAEVSDSTPSYAGTYHTAVITDGCLEIDNLPSYSLDAAARCAAQQGYDAKGPCPAAFVIPDAGTGPSTSPKRRVKRTPSRARYYRPDGTSQVVVISTQGSARAALRWRSNHAASGMQGRASNSR